MYDLIIIGAGPAGLTAAFYAGRFRLKTLLLEKLACGGQIITSPTIENFPGFGEGTLTIDLIDRIKAQVDSVGVAVQTQEVTGISCEQQAGRIFYAVKTAEMNYQARSLIIASGASPKKLGVKGEDRLIGRGVSYCGTCDAPFFKNKEIAVVGAGDRAIEEALFLTSYASKVTIIARRQELRASKILEEKARMNDKIYFIFDSVVEEICGENRLEGLKIKNLKNQAVSDFSCHGVFVFVGIRPNTEFVKKLLHINESGFIITQSALATSRPGIFAAGDCCQKTLYQVINACGDGAVAADSAHKYLLSLRE